MQPGNAALFVLIKNMTPDKWRDSGRGSTVLKRSLATQNSTSRRAREASTEHAPPKTKPPKSRGQLR